MIFNVKLIKEYIKNNYSKFLERFLVINSKNTEEIFKKIIEGDIQNISIPNLNLNEKNEIEIKEEKREKSINLIPNFFDEKVEDEDIEIIRKDYKILNSSLIQDFLFTQNTQYRFLKYTYEIKIFFDNISKKIRQICAKYEYLESDKMNNYIIKESTLWNTGHLPFFYDDMFCITDKRYFLTPTTEINFLEKNTDTNIKRDTPKKFFNFHECFRREGGVHGSRDSYIRFNQFYKNELFVLASFNDTKDYAMEMVKMCCELLDEYKISYRVLKNGKSNISLTSHYTYDIECWSSTKNKYIEVSSCSNTGFYQTMRCDIKVEKDNSFAVAYNGTFIAMERILFCLLDNGIKP